MRSKKLDETRAGSSASPTSIHDRIGGASNVLFQCPPIHTTTSEVCTSLLTEPSGEPMNLLLVDLVSTNRSIAQWFTKNRKPPRNLTIIGCHGRVREVPIDDQHTIPGEVTIKSISSPSDLTGMGIDIQETLERWHETDESIVVCLDSLTALLQYVDLEKAFQFVNVLTSNIAAVDGQAHYHLDPKAHDERTLQTLQSLFDGVVELTRDGEVRARSR